jgi:hypothetical protein
MHVCSQHPPPCPLSEPQPCPPFRRGDPDDVGPKLVAGRFWQASEAIPGKRISWTKSARVIITQAEAKPEFSVAYIREGEPEFSVAIKKPTQSEFLDADMRGAEPEHLPPINGEEFSDAVSRETLFGELPPMAAPAKPMEPIKRLKIVERQEGQVMLP